MASAPGRGARDYPKISPGRVAAREHQAAMVQRTVEQRTKAAEDRLRAIESVVYGKPGGPS